MSNISLLNRCCTLLDPFTTPSSCQASLNLYWAVLIQCELKDRPTLLGSGEVRTGKRVPAMFTLLSPAILPSSSLLLLNAEEIPKWIASTQSLPLSKEADFNLDSYFGFKNLHCPSQILAQWLLQIEHNTIWNGGCLSCLRMSKLSPSCPLNARGSDDTWRRKKVAGVQHCHKYLRGRVWAAGSQLASLIKLV